MKTLLKWVAVVAVCLGLLILFTNWFEQRRQQADADQARQLRERQQAEAQRAALIAAPPEQQPADQRVAPPPLNRQAEHAFRQIAEHNRVEVLEYRAVAPREVVVTLRTRNQTGIGDTLDEATRRDIIWDFDLPMMERTSQVAVDPTSGAHIWTARTTIKLESE